MVCGASLVYGRVDVVQPCHFCQRPFRTQVLCEEQHAVCDSCHAADAVAAIERICSTSKETDMLTLLRIVRSHDAIPVNGPEHHGMVPAIMIATYRNLGGALPEDALALAIQRGMKVPGGFCGAAGACGAALGVGIGFSVMLQATPLQPRKRQQLMAATSECLSALAEKPAARCCQRDCWLALRKAAELSRSFLEPPLRAADADWRCTQWLRNKPCQREACPMAPEAFT